MAKKNKKPSEVRIYKITDKGTEEIITNPNNENDILKIIQKNNDFIEKITPASKFIKGQTKLIEKISPLVNPYLTLKTSTNLYINQLQKEFDKSRQSVQSNYYTDLLENKSVEKEYIIQNLENKVTELQGILKKISYLINPNLIISSKNIKKRSLSANNLDLESTLYIFESITPRLNKSLFINFNKYLIEQIFNNEQLREPIKLQKQATIRDLRYFLDKLSSIEILKNNILTDLEKINAFEVKGTLIKARSLTHAKEDKNSLYPKFKDIIDDILSAFD